MENIWICEAKFLQRIINGQLFRKVYKYESKLSLHSHDIVGIQLVHRSVVSCSRELENNFSKPLPISPNCPNKLSFIKYLHNLHMCHSSSLLSLRAIIIHFTNYFGATWFQNAIISLISCMRKMRMENDFPFASLHPRVWGGLLKFN